MANDRIFAVCRVCKGAVLLVKYYPYHAKPVGHQVGGSFNRTPDQTCAALAWHVDHCHPNSTHQDLEGNELFFCVTENTSKFRLSDDQTEMFYVEHK